MRVSTKIFIGFALVLLLLVLNFWVNSTLFGKVSQNAEFLTKSEMVIRNSTRLHKTMIDMQSGFRGFLLTSNEKFLEPYFNGAKNIPSLVSEQKLLITETPLQTWKLDSIMELHNQWMLYSSSIIEAKRDSIVDSAGEAAYKLLLENQLKKEVGKKLNDQIAEKFREFDQFEYRVRQDRREILNTSLERTRNVSLSLVIASAIIGLLCGWYLMRIISNRISVMVKLAEQISRGDFKTIVDRAGDELTDLSRSLNSMSLTLDKNFTDLEKKNKELDQFAYVVSHDLKAPLRGIDNVCQWIEEDMQHELSPEMKNYLEIMRGRVHRLEDLINGLLEYARIGRSKRIVEEVSVKQMLEEVVDLVVPDSFTVVMKGSLPQLPAERIRLEQVFANLLSNAVKHHDKPTGIITITAEEKDDYFIFTIEDDGPGIEPEYHEKIFGIFQTLRERNTKESTGVGLAIVKKIIDDQKGTISVTSAPGKGAAFKFTWPKVPVTVQELQPA